MEQLERDDCLDVLEPAVACVDSLFSELFDGDSDGDDGAWSRTTMGGTTVGGRTRTSTIIHTHHKGPVADLFLQDLC